jgi:hypothetical protein
MFDGQDGTESCRVVKQVPASAVAATWSSHTLGAPLWMCHFAVDMASVYLACFQSLLDMGLDYVAC